MDTESVSSEHSERSKRHKNSKLNTDGIPRSLCVGSYSSKGAGALNTAAIVGSGGLDLHEKESRLPIPPREHNKIRGVGMAPYQTTVSIPGNQSRDGQEIIEVQILPQDENWGENTTAITGNTSEQSISMEDVNKMWHQENKSSFRFTCRRYVDSTLTLILALGAYLSPIVMVVLPKLGFFPNAFDYPDISSLEKAKLLSCSNECKGLLVSLVTRLVLLILGVWALFLRKPTASLPRVFVFRTIVLLLIIVSTFSYWLFYLVQVSNAAQVIVDGGDPITYTTLVAYATTFVDTLLFIHYIAVVLLELRQREPFFYIKVVRSPDGASQSYCIGHLSIQRAAVWVLQKYYVDFPIYNPYLERIPVSKTQCKQSSSFKYYEVDSASPSQQPNPSRAVLAANARRRDSSHNERFYEEHEFERRVKKRRARLITAAEEAFTHIKRIHNEPAPAIPLDPNEAAQAVFPSMARALQKFLRVTRQQPRHTFESILKHLSNCLKHDLSPRAFLEPFLNESPVLQNEKERRSVQSWSLVCDELLTRLISDETTFQLIQCDVSLIIQVHRLPHFNISEEVVDPKSNRFVLKLNSETSV